MTPPPLTRRDMLGAGLALGAATLVPGRAAAQQTIVATAYPGSFEEAYRTVLVPRVKQATGAEVTLTPMLVVEQVAKITAARANPPFDVVLFDEGPLLDNLDTDILAPFPAARSQHLAQLPEAFRGINNTGPTVSAQVIGLAYNPKKVRARPTSWNDLWRAELKGRVGLTGMASSLGTAYMCEISKLNGGSEKDFEPAFRRVKELLPNVASVAASPGALAALFQQGEIDIAPNYLNNVMLLKHRGVDIDFAVPGNAPVLIRTSMHIVKNSKVPELAARYIDIMLSPEVQRALMDPPFFFVPTNSNVKFSPQIAFLGADVPDMMHRSIILDWAEINKQRPRLIDRFNREIRI
ncbi:MAG: extracellular solute-binding protein [Pseudomonadota bacterium]